MIGVVGRREAVATGIGAAAETLVADREAVATGAGADVAVGVVAEHAGAAGLAALGIGCGIVVGTDGVCAELVAAADAMFVEGCRCSADANTEGEEHAVDAAAGDVPIAGCTQEPNVFVGARLSADGAAAFGDIACAERPKREPAAEEACALAEICCPCACTHGC